MALIPINYANLDKFNWTTKSFYCTCTVQSIENSENKKMPLNSKSNGEAEN